MVKVGTQAWDEVHACHFIVDVEGWRWCFDLGDRFGTDPVALLSTSEHRTLERLLKGL